MPRYVFNWRYRSSYGAGLAGEEVDLDEATAEAINRDSPGVLSEVETRAMDAPPSDRMVKRPRTRNDRDPANPIDKTTYKAVRRP